MFIPQAPPPIQVVTQSKPVSVPVSCHWTPSLTVHQSKQVRVYKAGEILAQMP